RRYDEMSRNVDDLADRLHDLGVDAGAARAAIRRQGDVGDLAKAYVGAVSVRKDLLYRAAERSRVTAVVIGRLVERQNPPRILLFHERIDEAAALFNELSALPVPIALEHSGLSDAQRQTNLARFADGSSSVLVSVKSLIEGIDVPDADIGVSVAS